MKVDSIAVDDKDKYACIYFDEDNCGLKPYCQYAGIEEHSSSSIECSSYPVTDENKFKCINAPAGGDPTVHCKEQYLCEQLIKTEKTGTGISCSDLVLTEGNEETHICIDDEDVQSTKACKKIKKCSEVTNADTDQDCIHYGIENNPDKNKKFVQKKLVKTILKFVKKNIYVIRLLKIKV